MKKRRVLVATIFGGTVYMLHGNGFACETSSGCGL